MQAQGSSYPHRENYLSLDPDYQDAHGQPLARITFDWRENDRKMSEYCTRKMEDIAKAMDATILSPAVPRKAPFDTRQYQSTHVTGGTPMGPIPRPAWSRSTSSIGTRRTCSSSELRPIRTTPATIRRRCWARWRFGWATISTAISSVRGCFDRRRWRLNADCAWRSLDSP